MESALQQRLLAHLNSTITLWLLTLWQLRTALTIPQFWPFKYQQLLCSEDTRSHLKKLLENSPTGPAGVTQMQLNLRSYC